MWSKFRSVIFLRQLVYCKNVCKRQLSWRVHHRSNSPLIPYHVLNQSPLLLKSLSFRFLPRLLSYGGKDISNFLDSVKSDIGSSDGHIKERQISFLNSIFADSSEISTELLNKRNSASNLSGAEVYDLAAVVFQNRFKIESGDSIAAVMFEYSGELGDTNALYTYAQLLTTGQGVPRDLKKAYDIMTQLSLKGHPYAQFALGVMFYNGIGVEQNFNRAFTLFKVSSQNFVPQAFNLLGEMYKSGQGVSEDIDEAVKCFKKGAELGDPGANLSLALCYTYGKGVEISAESAFRHHQEASKSGHPVAVYNLAVQYFAGNGTEQNFEKAVEFYEQAADVGFAPAQINLGKMYYNGVGVIKDRSKAKELYRLAATTDNAAKVLLQEIEEEENKERQLTVK